MNYWRPILITLLINFLGSGLVPEAGAAEEDAAPTTTSESDEIFLQEHATDANGNVYAAGYLQGTSAYDFGNGIIVKGSAIGFNGLVVKYDFSGSVLWARTTSIGTSDSRFYGVAVGLDGSVYVAGAVTGNGVYQFGSGASISGVSHSLNAVLVKFSASGTAEWAKTTTTGTSESNYYGVALHSDGNIYTVGYIHGNGLYGFGNNVTATAAVDNYNIIIVKYDSTGSAQWARTTTTASLDSYFYEVTVASDGNIYASGYINGNTPYSFGTGASVAGTAKTSNALTVKYSPSGAAQWAESGTTDWYLKTP